MVTRTGDSGLQGPEVAMDGHGKIAVITGASSGIGAATAVRLADEGFEIVLGARRMDRLQEIADKCGGTALELDVTDPVSVQRFSAKVQNANVLVNNAGLALGTETLDELSEEHSRIMWETNVLGLLRVTRAFLPKLEASGDGHVVNLGSVAGIEAYKGGAGYTTTKHAVRAISQTLRLELMGKPIRITEVAPGAVETEFSIVRYQGDTSKADHVYEGYTPLTSEDIADCIAWAVTRPPHVNIDFILVKPIAQAQARVIHKGPIGGRPPGPDQPEAGQG